MNMPIAKAELLVWTPKVSLHVPDIDQEQRVLVGLANGLHSGMLAGRGVETLETFLPEFTRYATCLCADEEKLMAAIHYPDIWAHVREHQDQLHRIKMMRDSFDRGETMATIKMMVFISHTTSNHVMVADRQLRAYILR